MGGPVVIPEAELVANVRRSTETAVNVVQHLEQSLARGGFAAGLAAYGQMTETLAGQRFWSLDKSDGEIERNFRDLTAAAARVHAMLAPYVRMMERLGALAGVTQGPASDHPGSPPVKSDGLTPDQRTVVGELRAAPEPLTISGLRTRTGLGTRHLRELLQELEAKGLTKATGPEQRRRYAAVAGAVPARVP
jgi:hypothetical protein